jgi:glycosyltransferase involved in cell wall biosynthesis
VTALADNAGAFSAPEPGRANSLPDGVTGDQVGRAVAQAAERRYPRTPTGNAFCMLIRRDCLDEVGMFDAEAFPRGYGEENDFCMRARQQGWRHLVDDSTFVLHSRSASFGDDKQELMDAGLVVINRRYPEYQSLVQDFIGSEAMASARGRIGHTLAGLASGVVRPRPRVLFVLHDAGGGTPATTEDLIGGLDPSYEALVLVSNGSEVRLERWVNGANEVVFGVALEPPVRPEDFTHAQYRRIVTGILVRYAIDVVHIRHLIGHSFDTPAVAGSLGIPVVMSFHDFYYVCPTVHLIDNEGRFCGGSCTPGQGECPVPTRWLQGLPHLKHEWVYEWRKGSEEMFENVDIFVTASESTRSYYVDVFPELAKRRFEVIEHGRDEPITTPPLGVAVAADDKARILLAGHLDPHKGSQFVKDLADLDGGERLEFHGMGRMDPLLEDSVVDHGTYARHEFAKKAKEIAPTFVGLFSTTAESHSHVLSEAWRAGIPVLASDRGALQERIDRSGGGWLIDVDDPEAAYARILEIVEDRSSYEKQMAKTGEAAAALRTIDEMAIDYAALYDDLREQRRSFGSITASGPA